MFFFSFFFFLFFHSLDGMGRCFWLDDIYIYTTRVDLAYSIDCVHSTPHIYLLLG